MHVVTAAELGPSWRPGCPVGPEQLRRVELDHLGFDGRTARGELIVHADLVDEVIAIFGALHRAGFPIEKMRTVVDMGWRNIMLRMSRGGAMDRAKVRDSMKLFAEEVIPAATELAAASA